MVRLKQELWEKPGHELHSNQKCLNIDATLTSYVLAFLCLPCLTDMMNFLNRSLSLEFWVYLSYHFQEENAGRKVPVSMIRSRCRVWRARTSLAECSYLTNWPKFTGKEAWSGKGCPAFCHFEFTLSNIGWSSSHSCLGKSSPVSVIQSEHLLYVCSNHPMLLPVVGGPLSTMVTSQFAIFTSCLLLREFLDYWATVALWSLLL
jgi:hypothetical protein